MARVIAITATYAGVRYLAGQLDPSQPFDPIGELAAATVMGITLAWIVTITAGQPRGRVAAIGLVVFASVAAVMLEGSAFAPTLSPVAALPLGLALQLGVSGVTAAVAVASSPDRPAQLTARRAAGRVTARVAAAPLVYITAYFVSGAISYTLVTGSYYTAHASGLTRPEPAVVLVVAGIEGVLLTLGSLPLATALTGPRRSRALACGLALWALGGLVPLLQEAGIPDVVRVASVIEILFQKVPLGMAVVWLLGGSNSRSLEPTAARRLRGVAA